MNRHLFQLLQEMDNVGHACEGCASKPGGFKGQDPASFVGRHVKLCFPMAAGGTENMWLWVERLAEAADGSSAPGELIGSLQNEPTEPLALGDFHHGDLFAFTVDEIAAVEP